MLEKGAKYVIGLDIADSAIEAAKKNLANSGISLDRYRFQRYTTGDPLEVDEDVDIVMGPGILEYIRPQEVVSFLKQFDAKNIFFSLDERIINVQKTTHFFYRNIKRIPYYKQFKQRKIKQLLEDSIGMKLRTFREADNA